MASGVTGITSAMKNPGEKQSTVSAVVEKP